MSDVTEILGRIEAGDGNAAEHLLPLVYEELRQLAAFRMAQQPPGQTLQATDQLRGLRLQRVRIGIHREPGFTHSLDLSLSGPGHRQWAELNHQHGLWHTPVLSARKLIATRCDCGSWKAKRASCKHGYAGTRVVIHPDRRSGAIVAGGKAKRRPRYLAPRKHLAPGGQARGVPRSSAGRGRFGVPSFSGPRSLPQFVVSVASH